MLQGGLLNSEPVSREDFFSRHQPVEVIAGVKIYDSKILPLPFRNHNLDLLYRYGTRPRKLKLSEIDQLLDLLRQDGSRLDHIFIQNAATFISNIRSSDIKLQGLFPSLEMHFTNLSLLYQLTYDALQPNDKTVLTFYQQMQNLLIYQGEERDLGIFAFLAEYQRNSNSLQGVIRIVLLSYESLGYTPSYFTFVKLNHPLRLAKEGKVPLRPSTFEPFSLLNLTRKLDVKFWGSDTECFAKTDRHVPNVAGWRKQDLFDAIKRSGLWKDVSTVKRIKGRYSRRYDYSKGILWLDVGVTRIDRQKQEIVTGLGRTPYKPYCHYAHLYRLIYSTMDFIDWPLLCKLNAVSLENLRDVAIRQYNADPELISQLPITDICAFVTDQSRKRRELTSELAATLAQAAGEASEGFVARPGSRWIQAASQQTMLGGRSGVLLLPSNDYELYLQVKEYCEDDNLTKEALLNYTEGLNIRSYLPDNVDKYSKSDLCDYLLDFLLPRAEKYESVLFDCADPAIKVRHIINSANTMGLGALFPKDISKLTKDQACFIISNYIQLLRDASKLTIAPEYKGRQ